MCFRMRRSGRTLGLLRVWCGGTFENAECDPEPGAGLKAGLEVAGVENVSERLAETAGWRVDWDVGSFSGVEWPACDSSEREDEAAMGAFESLGIRESVWKRWFGLARERRRIAPYGHTQHLYKACRDKNCGVIWNSHPSVSEECRLQHSLRCSRKKELDVGYYCCVRGESHHGNCPFALPNIGQVGGSGALIFGSQGDHIF